MVCAICGRMPLMMQSAPISRAAATVLSRCWATSVSTVGTPVMSMIAMLGAGLDDALQQALHHDLRARAVERADQRQREDAVPQLDDRRGQLEHLLLLAADDLFAALLVDLGRVAGRARSSSVRRRSTSRRASALGVVAELAAQAREQRLLEREHEGRRLRRREAPQRARARQVLQHAADVVPLAAFDVVEAHRAARLVRSRPRNSVDCVRSSLSSIEARAALNLPPVRASIRSRMSRLVSTQQFGDVRLQCILTPNDSLSESTSGYS